MAKGYTINKLSYESGVAQSYLRDIELGNKDNPTLLVLSHIGDALDVSLKDFFEDDTEKSFLADELMTSIYRPNAEQRATLNQFLQSLLSSDSI